MILSELNLEPIVATEEEQSNLVKLVQLLNSLSNGDCAKLPRIVSPEGEEIELPASVFRLLHQLVHQLAQGKGVMSWTFHQPLTIEEASALLDFPRQHLVKLLKDGEIPATGEGIKRRIEFYDLMAYQKKWEELRHQAIVEIAQISHEAGLYFTEQQQTNPSMNMPVK